MLVTEAVEEDSSTGPCQIFTATAIKARGLASYNGYLDAGFQSGVYKFNNKRINDKI